MILMPDVLRATKHFISIPREQLTRSTYNLAAISFSPLQIASMIQQRHVSDFRVKYEPDTTRQNIAESWPRSVSYWNQ